MDSRMKPFAYVKQTIGASASPLAVPNGPVRGAIMRVEGADVRWRMDGTAPTSTDGMPLLQTDEFSLQFVGDVDWHDALVNMLLIRAAGTDATLHVQFFGVK
jgi:hypothetical protein